MAWQDRPDSGATIVSPRARATTLFLLTATYFSSYVDRQILAILQERIKQDLTMSDAQLGLVSGLMFAVFYATLAVPVARIADRTNRRNVVAISLAIWSGMTIVCGLAQNFVQLALGRVGVGIGEAGSTPASQSILADLYPAKSRASAMAVFSLGPILGGGFGTLLGGVIAHHYGWRVAMFSLGLPGLILALLVRYFAVEPRRGLSDPVGDAAAYVAAPSIFEAFRSLWRCRPAVHLITAMMLTALISYAVVGWGPSYMQRSLGLSMIDISRYVAVPGALLGLISALAGGRIADIVARRYGVYAQSWVVAAVKTVAYPFSIIFFLFAEAPVLALVGYFGSILFASAYLGPSFALVQYLTPLNMRAMWAAIGLLVINLFGLGLGPLAVGLVSDLLQPRFGAESLRYAMLAIVLCTPWPIFHYWRAGALMRRMVASAA